MGKAGVRLKQILGVWEAAVRTFFVLVTVVNQWSWVQQVALHRCTGLPFLPYEAKNFQGWGLSHPLRFRPWGRVDKMTINLGQSTTGGARNFPTGG